MEGANPQVECELGAVVPTIRLCEQTKIVVLVLGEQCVESLQKLPHKWCSGDRRVCIISAEAEAGANGLVYVENVGVLIPTMRIQRGN